MPFTPQTVFYAFIGGIVPALIWLYFLLKEDARCPEPRHVILIALVAGMIAVPLALPLEHVALVIFPGYSPYPGLPVLLSWAAIEELLKYALAAVLVLWRREVNESIDFVVYMITVALGFAAIENMLFLITPLAQGQLGAGLATQNLRFVGSTLVHVVASALVGFSLAISYVTHNRYRVFLLSCGLILAIALHTLFNFLIIEQGGSRTALAFFTVWIGTVVFFALFEILKYFRYHKLPKNTC